MRARWRAGASLEALVDALLIMGGYAGSLLLLFGNTIPEHNVTALRDTLPLACLGGFVLLAVYGLYADRYRPFRETLVNLAAAIGLLAVGVSALAFFLRGFAFPRFVLATAPVFHMVFLSLWHGWLHLRRRKRRGVFAMAVLGAAEEPCAPGLLAKIQGSLMENRQMQLSGWFNWQEWTEETRPDAMIPNWRELNGILLLSDVPDRVRRACALACARDAKTLLCMPKPADILLAGAAVRQFGDVPVLAVDHTCRQPELQWVKRLFDILFSGLLLVVLSPVFLLTMLLVRFSGKGPVFFVQERVTWQGQVFQLVKFRTMIPNAEAETGPVLASSRDPRVTPVGRVLRKMRLDELPQLWNILRGQMSVVGPRPERPVFVSLHEQALPGYALRHTVRAGLTGLAQVYGNYATTAADKLAFDLIYIRDWSLLLDLQIVLKTATAVFRREAAEGVVPEQGASSAILPMHPSGDKDVLRKTGNGKETDTAVNKKVTVINETDTATKRRLPNG